MQHPPQFRSCTCVLIASVMLFALDLRGAQGEEAAKPASGLESLVELLDQVDDPAFQLDLLRGMDDALNGQRQLKMPPAWAAVYPKLLKSPEAEVRRRATLLAVIFGDRQAQASLRKLAADPRREVTERAAALEACAQSKDPELVPVLHLLLGDRALRSDALRALAAFDAADTPRVVLAGYASFSDAEKRDAISTLCSRPAYALALLEAVRLGRVPRADVSAFNIQALVALGDNRVASRLESVWGLVRPTAADKSALIEKFKAQLTPGDVKKADLPGGRLVFSKTCASCHVLFEAGTRIGPELTGAQRNNLDYVLSNVLDPSAVVARDYQMTLIQTEDGRVISGIVKQEDEQAVSIQTANAVVVTPKSDIELRRQLSQSMMPDGLLDKLSPIEVRDLVGYLASPVQVPLPPVKP